MGISFEILRKFLDFVPLLFSTMEEYSPQIIHNGSRHKQENITIPAENVQSRPIRPQLYKAVTPPCRTDFAHTLHQDAEINYEQSPKVKPNRSGNRKTTVGRQNLPPARNMVK